MISVEEILRQAHQLGFNIDSDGTCLEVFSIDGAKRDVPSDFVETLRQAKPMLIAYLSRRPCPGWGTVPPADLPLRTAPVNLSPKERNLIIEFVSRQLSDAKLADWLCDREERYYGGAAKHWDCCEIMLASAVDLACWQLNRNMHEVCQLLAAFEDCANDFANQRQHR